MVSLLNCGSQVGWATDLSLPTISFEVGKSTPAQASTLAEGANIGVEASAGEDWHITG